MRKGRDRGRWDETEDDDDDEERCRDDDTRGEQRIVHSRISRKEKNEKTKTEFYTFVRT